MVLPKSDGSKLNIEMLRSEQWVRNQLGYTLAPKSPAWHPPMALILEGDSDEADNAAVADADAQSEASEEGAYRFVLSPVRPLLRDLLLTKACYAIDDSIDLIALTVELDLPEMGATGTAVITDIHPCAAVAPGNGQVVTATFSHPPSNEVLNVIFEGESQPVGVTDNHLFWSVNRQQFLPIGKMEIGEQVQTFHGETKRIEQKLARPGPEIVYNLEVYDEHVYFVGEQGLLAHNMYDVNGNVVYRDDLDGLFPAPRRGLVAVDGGYEHYYRAMSIEHYDEFLRTGTMPATTETFISPTKSFSESYSGVLVKFQAKAGTYDELMEVGFRAHGARAADLFPDLPTVKRGWGKRGAQFKPEGAQVNIGLGKGKAIDIFNDNIVGFETIQFNWVKKP